MDKPFLENYWIKAELRRDKISTLYKAIKADTGEEVLLYKINVSTSLLESQKTEKISRLKQELESVKILDHPNIARTLNFFKEKGEYFLEVEYFEGKNLKTIWEEKHPFKLSEALHIYMQASCALRYAHAQGVIHRNLSPSNIYITDQGRVKLTGFGLHLSNVDESLKKIGTSFIPPRNIDYLAPEQLEENKLDERVDVYSLAAVMYELFTGQPPHQGEDRDSFKRKKLNNQPKLASAINPTIPVELEKLLDKSLSLKPEKRLKDMDAVVKKIQAILKSEKFEDRYIRADVFKKISAKVLPVFGGFGQKVEDFIDKFRFERKKGNEEVSSKKPTDEERKSPVKIDQPPSEEKNLESDASDGNKKTIDEISGEEKNDPMLTSLSRRLKINGSDTAAAGPGSNITINISTRSIWNFAALLILILLAYILGASLMKNYLGIRTARDVEGLTREAPNPGVKQTPADVEESAPRGTFLLAVDVPEAYVYLRNLYNRSVPPIQKLTADSGKMTRFSLFPGTYVLRVEKEMFQDYEARFEVMPGRLKIIRVEMKKKEPRLRVVTQPNEAKVYLNNVLYGTTPLSLFNIRYGKYTIKIKKEGYEEFTGEVNVTSGNSAYVKKELIKAGKDKEEKPTEALSAREVKTETSYFSVISKPANARVVLNGKDFGVTPLLKKEYRAGEYIMEVKKDGYQTEVKRVTIKPETLSEFYFDLNKSRSTPLSTPSLPTATIPTGTPTKASAVTKTGEKEPQTNVKLLVKVRVAEGVAYDKLKRRPVIITYNKTLLEERINEMLEASENIEVTQSAFDADLLLLFQFAVGVNTQTISTKPDLTLYSNLYVSDVEQRTTYYNASTETELPFPTSSTTEKIWRKSDRIYDKDYIDFETATEPAEQFITKFLPGAINEIAKYDPEKHSSYSKTRSKRKSFPGNSIIQPPGREGSQSFDNDLPPGEGRRRDSPLGEDRPGGGDFPLEPLSSPPIRYKND